MDAECYTASMPDAVCQAYLVKPPFQNDVQTAPDFQLVMNDINSWIKGNNLDGNYLTVVDRSARNIPNLL